MDPHTVAGLMKAYFREQKSSIIPRGEPLAAIVKAVEEKNVGYWGRDYDYGVES